jgi:hypothetical protein
MLYHWRAHSGAEVDLIIEKDGLLWPIEFKLAGRPGLNDARGLASFAASYPHYRIGQRIIVSGGQEAYQLDRDTVVVPLSLL